MVYNTLWAEAFNPNDTRDLPFHVDSRTVKQVPTMSRIGKYRNGNLANLKASFIELPLQVNSIIIKLYYALLCEKNY